MLASSPHDPIAAYALAALDEPTRRAFEQHIDRCRRCRLELRELAAAAAVLAYQAEPAEPPVGLRERILDLVENELQERPVP